MKQLGDHEVGDLVVNRGSQEDDSLVEQPAVDVELALPARGPFDHHRDQRHAYNPTPNSRRGPLGR
jgi:hypothetical protein